MNFLKIALINVLIFIVTVFFTTNQWYFLILTVAQLVYVPFVLHLITRGDHNWFTKYVPYVSIPALLSVVCLQLTTYTLLNSVLAAVYFIFTVIVAVYGLSRFLNRGFAYLEEFMLDMGLIYLAIGGAWYFASEANMDTGFSPILTWLTSIHFHYASFLLPVFAGLLGRLYKPALYKWIGALILIAPIIVAVGITYSTLLELISVLTYIIGIYGLIILSLKAQFYNSLQKWMVRTSFASLGLSIVFSLLYAYGNLSGTYNVTINFMLLFHGITNCLLFALVGAVGWSIKTPGTKQRDVCFPISKIKGKWTIGETILSGKKENQKYTGLVDDMKIYQTSMDFHDLSPGVIDFYENTTNYHLFAEVKWHKWFIPLASVYKLLSRYMKQINLPLSSSQVEMTGEIVSIREEVDGRNNPRAWVRKANEETVFIAIYSYHQTGDRTYMNIALPLPWSTMTGILELNPNGQQLELTSKKKETEDADSGIYLTVKNFLFKLPIEERFLIEDDGQEMLKAQHTMWIFAIPFLTINYSIRPKA